MPDASEQTSCFDPSPEYPHGWVMHPLTGKRLRLRDDAVDDYRHDDPVPYYYADADDEDGGTYRVVWEISDEYAAKLVGVGDLEVHKYNYLRDRDDPSLPLEARQQAQAYLAAVNAEIAAVMGSSRDHSAACDWDKYEIE